MIAEVATELVGPATALLQVDPKEHHARFRAADPFPHIVLDLAFDQKLETGFPDLDWAGWDKYQDGHQPGKRICSRLSQMPPTLRDAVEGLHRTEFLEWLEQLSGIDHLIPDPHLEGGGLHASGPGGILRTHTDFHRYQRLDVYRRLNLLVYLNEDWHASDGGSLQLHSPGENEPTVEVVPSFGRVVIFETSDRSPHGFLAPVAPGRVRKSIALYYYTATPTPEYSGDTNTYWLGESRKGTPLRRVAYRSLQQLSRIAAVGAHAADPNRGLRDLVNRRRSR